MIISSSLLNNQREIALTFYIELSIYIYEFVYTYIIHTHIHTYIMILFTIKVWRSSRRKRAFCTSI